MKVNFNKERFCVGLDIGSSAIKIVKLKFLNDLVELCSFDVEPLKLDLGEALRKLKATQALDSVNIGVSGLQTVIRYANFPRMNAQELRQALKFEAQKHIPFNISEVNLDGVILKDDLSDSKMLVLISAAKKELISGRVKLIESVGSSINTIDMDSIALVNAFIFNNPSFEYQEHKAIALLNIGSCVTNLDIVESGIPRLSRDIHIASSNFTQKIMSIFELDSANAESLKINPDAERANKVKAAVESVLANLAAEVRTSFDYYESQSATSVVKIFLSGGGSNFTGLNEMLGHSLGIEVEYWDPLKKLQIAQGLDTVKLKQSSNQLAIAVGLALR
ncbi:MAG: type IV pilus assembly protein PilM [Candidatus Omnitrophica bacterium]|nr:type IV pilus assembly protein PilM [Candidatus Omnitrophota bacterium]